MSDETTREQPLQADESEWALADIAAMNPTLVPRVWEQTLAGHACRLEPVRLLLRTCHGLWLDYPGYEPAQLLDRLGRLRSEGLGCSLLDAVGGEQMLRGRWRGDVAQPHTMDYHVEAVRESHRLRVWHTGLVALASEARAGAVDSGDLSEGVSRLQSKIADLSGEDRDHIEQVMDALLEQTEMRLAGELVDYDTGIGPVDAITTFSPGSYTVVGAYSGHGKTTLMSAILAGLVDRHDFAAIVWQCEVPQVAQLARVIASAVSQSAEDVRRAGLAEHHILRPERLRNPARLRAKLHEAQRWCEGKQVYLRPPGAIRIDDVESRARALKARHPDRPLLLVVDYLQHMALERGRGADERQRIEECSRRLANLGSELDAVVLAASQYTDATNTPTPPIPMPRQQQMRAAKGVRNDADVVLSYHRPYAGSSEHADYAILEAAKTRYGVPAHAIMRADNGHNVFDWWRGSPLAVEGLTSRRAEAPGYEGGQW